MNRQYRIKTQCDAISITINVIFLYNLFWFMSRMRVIYVFVNIGNFGLTSQNPLQSQNLFFEISKFFCQILRIKCIFSALSMQNLTIFGSLLAIFDLPKDQKNYFLYFCQQMDNDQSIQSDLERKLRIRTENLFASGIMNLLSDTAPAGINHYHLLLFF